MPGLVASTALVVYTILTLAIFKLVPVTLTLAGIGAFVLSLGALGALGGLYVKVTGEIGELVDKEMKPKGGGESLGSQMMKDTKIDSGGRIGLWTTAAGLLVLAFLSGRALKERDDDVPRAQALPPAAG